MTEKKKSKKNLISNIIFVVLIGLLIWPTSRSYIHQGMMKIGFFRPNVEKGQVKPEELSSMEANPESMLLTDAQGKQINTADLKGKVVFVNLWATWCGPCRAEMPTIQKLYDKYKDNDKVAFVLLEIEGNKEGGMKFMQQEKLSLPIYFPASELPKGWTSDQIPVSLVLNKKGVRVFKHVGMADYSTKDFEEYIVKLINE
ncbi:TlpA family protein disulfide reductase [Sphingobacterium kyonggiense]